MANLDIAAHFWWQVSTQEGLPWTSVVLVTIWHVPSQQILVDLEWLADNMPKIKRSSSEPYSLHYNHIPLEESFGVHSPHTPVQGVASDTFEFYPES